MVAFSDSRDTTVLVASPDQNIQARVASGDEVEIWFRTGSYRRYREDQLSHQLARLGSAAWIAYFRDQTEAHRRSQGLSHEEMANGERRVLEEPRRREFTEALNRLEGNGVSAGGTIRLRTEGLLRWNVDLEPGTIRALSEQRFLAELHSAVRSLINDREMQIILLKSELFDLGVPRKWLDLMKELKAVNVRRH